MPGFLLQPRFITKLTYRVPEYDFCCQRHNRDARDLADIGYRAGRARIHFDAEHFVILCNKLDVDHAPDMQRFSQLFRVIHDLRFCRFGNGSGRVYGNRIPRMDACPLHVLHDARDQDIRPVADRIHFELLAQHIFVHQDRVVLSYAVDHTDVLIDVLIADRDLHALPAENVRGTHEDRVAQSRSSRFCFFRGKYGFALRTPDAASIQHFIEALPVFRRIHIIGRSTEDRHAHFHESFGQFDGRLASELYHGAVRFFHRHDIFHIFRRQRFKIQLVRDVEVRADRLRIVVDNDGLPAFLRKSPGTVYRTEVKFDALPDADRAGAEDEHLFPVAPAVGFIFPAVDRIVVRRCGGKFSGTGIHHLEYRADSVLQAKRSDLFLRHARKPADDAVRELQPLRFRQKLRRQLPHPERVLHTDEYGDLVDEPDVNTRNSRNLLMGHLAAHGFRDLPDPPVIHDFQVLPETVVVQL